jgi:hypothetical protein
MSYLNRCSYQELTNPHRYVFTGPCAVTGKPYSVTIPGPELFALNQGAHVQTACPSLSAEDREFIISGTSPEGWKQLFGDEPGDPDTEEPGDPGASGKH